VQSFEKAWPASAADYPENAFDEFDSGLIGRGGKRKKDGTAEMEATLARMQPDLLAAAADKLDGTLNNQSLVVLFTCKGKKLLFVGDAQWGNWSYWLYGKAVSGTDPGITARARDILGSIDFYKVGHHGSTNATPKRMPPRAVTRRTKNRSDLRPSETAFCSAEPCRWLYADSLETFRGSGAEPVEMRCSLGRFDLACARQSSVAAVWNFSIQYDCYRFFHNLEQITNARHEHLNSPSGVRRPISEPAADGNTMGRKTD
jgi:hypothetical protein